jgi:hypothetical protein
MLKLVRQFPEKQARDIALENSYNRYWAHPECILMCMLADDDRDVRSKAVEKILGIRGIVEHQTDSVPDGDHDSDKVDDGDETSQ